ncbi:MAG: saccharopine dehydrogenase, partial [Myxococcales bacterium]|nr:saccharopine dehydrogenase [Myxococcales bacterium]
QVEDNPVGWDKRLGMFYVPFFMAATNSPVVRRAHALAGFPWGRDFVYREVMSTPGNAKGLAMAVGITAGLAGIAVAMKRPRLRSLLEKRAPQPGEGPPEAKRNAGHWKVRFVGEAGPDRMIYVAADDAGDPGYGSTRKMLGESALCLAQDPLTSEGGVITPSIAMGDALLTRLRKAGLRFEAAAVDMTN